MRKFLLLIFIIVSFHSSAQKIFGIVVDSNGDILPFSSISIKGTSLGASANSRGKFSVAVPPGIYTVLCQHIGYAAQEAAVTVADADEELVFVLKQQKLELKEVVIRSGANPADSIIRSAIKKRDGYLKETNAFTCDLYGKDMIRLRRLPKKILGQRISEEDRMDMRLDTSGAGIIYLSESVSKIALQQPDKLKMEVVSSRVSGSDGFGFTFPAFISMYENNVIVFTQKLNPRGFISPISDGAFNYYRYKFLGSFWEGGKEINSIRVIPRRMYEPLFSGIINITEGDWRIHSFDLAVTKKSQLEILDSLHITQFHMPLADGKWKVKNQLLHFTFSMLGIDAAGNFLNVYSNYNTSPSFDKRYFDDVVIKYDTGVNKKTRPYWDSIRPVPLERDEVKDYEVKDSLFEVKKETNLTKEDVDSLNKKQGMIKAVDLVWGGIFRTRYSRTNTFSWGVNALVKGLEYNPAEGVVANLSGYYSKRFEHSKNRLRIEPNLRYGFSNGHLNGWVNINLKSLDFTGTQKSKRYEWIFSGGRRVTQFNREAPISPLINSISTLFYGDNLMKTYENAFASAGYSKGFDNGLRIAVNALFEDRKRLDNTTKFTLFKKDSIKITPNYPVERNEAEFVPHKALLLSVDISFRPGQKYIQFPSGKMPIGSKYPLLTLNYTSGIEKLFGSGVNFSKWKFSISDDVNFRIKGLMKYKLGMGGFLNNKKVFLPDFQHFNGNLTAAAGEYVNSYQLVEYYTFSNTRPFFAFGHLEHHFNGMLTNKIPLFRRLNWHLVAGSNAFFVNSSNNHVEIFAGIENILKIFRVDVVAGFDNGKYFGKAVRIGLGGLIGGNMTRDGKSGSVSFGF